MLTVFLCVYVCVFALCASGPWNPASIPCALCSLWTHQAFKTRGWLNASAAQPSRTCATTTRRSVCTAFSISGPSFRSWRDTKRWGHGKRSAPCTRMASLCLYPPPSLFDRRSLSDVSAPIVCMLCSHIRCTIPSTCHRPWQTKLTCSTFSLAMPVFASSAQIKVKSLTTAFGRHAQLRRCGVAPWWGNYFSSALLWFLSNRAGPQPGTVIPENLKNVWS